MYHWSLAAESGDALNINKTPKSVDTIGSAYFSLTR
jgi:hypothetical protein